VSERSEHGADRDPETDSHGPGAGHAATLGCPCGYRVRARNADDLADHKADCPHADREMIPVLNEITAHALNEPREYAGDERMCAILFDEDYDGVATDMDGNVALLLTRAQTGETRELMDEIVAELEDSDE